MTFNHNVMLARVIDYIIVFRKLNMWHLTFNRRLLQDMKTELEDIIELKTRLIISLALGYLKYGQWKDTVTVETKQYHLERQHLTLHATYRMPRKSNIAPLRHHIPILNARGVITFWGIHANNIIYIKKNDNIADCRHMSSGGVARSKQRGATAQVCHYTLVTQLFFMIT